MGQVVVVGLDIAKSAFQVHGVDRDGEVVVRRREAVAGAAVFFRNGRALSCSHGAGNGSAMAATIEAVADVDKLRLQKKGAL